MTEQQERKTGLSYIMERMEKDKLITNRDVLIFMNDLDLPTLEENEISILMIEAGATATGFVKANDFFVFVMNQLYDPEESACIDAFQVFDKSESGFLPVGKNSHFKRF